MAEEEATWEDTCYTVVPPTMALVLLRLSRQTVAVTVTVTASFPTGRVGRRMGRCTARGGRYTEAASVVVVADTGASEHRPAILLIAHLHHPIPPTATAPATAPATATVAVTFVLITDGNKVTVMCGGATPFAACVAAALCQCVMIDDVQV
jgi:hypothetical protein